MGKGVIMSNTEELIQNSIGFLQKTFKALPVSFDSIRHEPLPSSMLHASILNFEWEPLEKIFRQFMIEIL